MHTEVGDSVTDRAGVGRYILSFLLAGIIGLFVQAANPEGWKGVKINLGIFCAVFVVFFFIGMASA